MMVVKFKEDSKGKDLFGEWDFVFFNFVKFRLCNNFDGGDWDFLGYWDSNGYGLFVYFDCFFINDICLRSNFCFNCLLFDDIFEYFKKFFIFISYVYVFGEFDYILCESIFNFVKMDWLLFED